MRSDLAVLGGIYAIANIERRLVLPAASFEELIAANRSRDRSV
jgi:hypothetical protein